MTEQKLLVRRKRLYLFRPAYDSDSSVYHWIEVVECSEKGGGNPK